MYDPQTEQWVALVCSILCALGSFVIGALLIIQVVAKRRKLAATQAWLSTPGRVASSMVERLVTEYVGESDSVSYDPCVSYTYEVGGQTYTSKAIQVGAQRFYARRGSAEAVVRRYPAGQIITVYYNPQNPAEAALERSTPYMGWGLGCAALSLALAACLGCGVMYTVALEYFGMPNPFGP
ncbi:MAG TPA: DUF3592 domain-containing protein [Anaerolineales bacterium]|nr:DUF3592 domain-containing protein [Anaerolineales bacterium]